MKLKESTTLFKELDTLRGSDQQPSQEIKERLVDLYLPVSVSDLAVNLSNITSQFYALQLQLIGEHYGVREIRLQSEKLFYNLGKVKAEQALAKDPNMDRDCRAFVSVAISAIYTSSPEFKFQVKEYTPDYTVITLTGVDRYHRAAKQYKIDQYLSFPTLVAFMDGIKEYLQLRDVTIEVAQSSYDEKSNIECTYIFKKNGS